MVGEDQRRYAKFIKDCHENLRNRAKLVGWKKAWREHTENVKQLKEYAEAMNNLSIIWENNSKSDQNLAKSRIKWISDFCREYFYDEKIYIKKRLKEQRFLEYWEGCITPKCEYNKVPDRLKVLDVGSCFNPFKEMKCFDVIAVDLYPASKCVYQCDFLETKVVENESMEYTFSETQQITALPKVYFDCVIFSLLLEYIPTSEQRIECCRKAYDLLKFEGILIVITPDSQHVGKNAMIMKNWRYTLARIGFNRIKFDKLPHITAMVFRKAISTNITRHWADLHQEPGMKFAIEIPQDKIRNNNVGNKNKI